MLISEGLWRRRFGGDANRIGRSVMFDGAPRTIIGVLSAGFEFPTPGFDAWTTPVMAPSTTLPPAALNSPVLAVFGRLSPHVSMEDANAELAVLHKRYAAENPGMLDARRDGPEVVLPLKDQIVANVRTMLWMLFGAVALVLLIGCANVAGLMPARARSRSREFAVRASLGAGRARLLRQVITESLLLTSIAGSAGLVLATGGVDIITSYSAFNLPRAGEIRLDGIVLAFAIAMSVITAFVSGIAPALSASRFDLASALKTAGASTAPGSLGAMRSLNPGALLVITQAAVTVVLLIGAMLLMQTVSRLHGVHPGFNPRNLLTIRKRVTS